MGLALLAAAALARDKRPAAPTHAPLPQEESPDAVELAGLDRRTHVALLRLALDDRPARLA